MVISLCRKSRSEAKASLQCRRGLFTRFCTAWRMMGTSTGEEVVTRMSTGRSRMRVIYHIENAGRERLASLKKDYETVQQGIHNILDS